MTEGLAGTLVTPAPAPQGCALTAWCDNNHEPTIRGDEWTKCSHQVTETGNADATVIAVSVEQIKPLSKIRMWSDSGMGYNVPGKIGVGIYGADQSGDAELVVLPEQARAFADVLRLTEESRWLADALVAAADFAEAIR
jgi:hypothetical protein